MSQIPITNDGPSPKKVAGRTIMPGATAYFEESTLPRHLRPGSEKLKGVVVENPLQALLGNPIKHVTIALAGLSDDQLDELELLEVAGDDRAGMAKAFQEERLRRADLSLNDETGSEGSDESNTNDESGSEGSDESNDDSDNEGTDEAK